jgi:hypothetical protein
VTRDRVKQMVFDILDENINTHTLTPHGVTELAEAVMKIWDQGWTWEVPRRDLTSDAT